MALSGLENMAKSGARAGISRPGNWRVSMAADVTRCSFRMLENHAGVGAAKAEGIRHDEFDLSFARRVRHEIDFGRDRQMIEVERRRNNLIPDRQNRKDRFDGAGGAEKMPDRRFRRGHG